MKTLDFTKLNAESVKSVVSELSQLLADFQVYYTNIRGFHWNIKGKDFYVMHAQFENIYNNVAEKIDEIAERILMLDGVPAHKFSEYLTKSKIRETGYISGSDEAIQHVMESTGYFLEQERKILKFASEAGDEATVAMMSDYIKEQEKQLWMLTAYLS